ncbi:hypothetical protein O3P69_000549 [Scylla paramamosain]|uniref:Transposase n=1 Tax=Scylla paramamosain TaxID=85552 RepID=A0AAW0UU41_SCYPA
MNNLPATSTFRRRRWAARQCTQPRRTAITASPRPGLGGRTKSLRQTARETHISKDSVNRIMKRLHWKCNIPRLCQALNEDDPDRRVEFCEWYLAKCADDVESNSVCGISALGIIGPFFFNETVNGESYLNLLQEFVGPQITEMFGEDSDIYFQQDGAPPHYHRDVRAYLDAVFPDTWIGRRGPH